MNSRMLVELGVPRGTVMRAANRAALELYAKAGFRSVERRVDHYSDPRDDGIIMERGIEIL